MQTEPIRRRTDGSIDYAFYHKRASMLRAETTTDVFKGLSAIKRPLALAASLAAAFALIRSE
jgi:hypothetical protein